MTEGNSITATHIDDIHDSSRTLSGIMLSVVLVQLVFGAPEFHKEVRMTRIAIQVEHFFIRYCARSAV